MKYERAKQIFRSADNIDVYLEGNPIWINQLNDDRETARVRDLRHNHESLVYLEDLKEGMQ